MNESKNTTSDIKQTTDRKSVIFLAVILSIFNTFLLNATMEVPTEFKGLEKEFFSLFQYAPFVLGPLGGIALAILLRSSIKQPVDDQDEGN